jgi:hypothetical protein
MVDLLVLTSLEQLILILKILFMYFPKQATLMRRSTVLSLPPQLVFHDSMFMLSDNLGHLTWAKLTHSQWQALV